MCLIGLCESRTPGQKVTSCPCEWATWDGNAALLSTVWNPIRNCASVCVPSDQGKVSWETSGLVFQCVQATKFVYSLKGSRMKAKGVASVELEIKKRDTCCTCSLSLSLWKSVSRGLLVWFSCLGTLPVILLLVSRKTLYSLLLWLKLKKWYCWRLNGGVQGHLSTEMCQ